MGECGEELNGVKFRSGTQFTLTFTALLVQKYKFWASDCGRELNAVNYAQVLTLLALLVQKYKYCLILTQKARSITSRYSIYLLC